MRFKARHHWSVNIVSVEYTWATESDGSTRMTLPQGPRQVESTDRVSIRLSSMEPGGSAQRLDLTAFDCGNVLATDTVDGETVHVHSGHPSGQSQMGGLESGDVVVDVGELRVVGTLLAFTQSRVKLTLCV